jgi:hypothetical protein
MVVMTVVRTLLLHLQPLLPLLLYQLLLLLLLLAFGVTRCHQQQELYLLMQ